MKDLRGKNAIVTGASRGIGVYIAKTLAAKGVNLALAARSVDALDETRRACEAMGVKAIAVGCDVSSIDQLQRLAQTTERELGGIDILVNNAGIELTDALTALSVEQIDTQLRVNLNAPIWLTKIVLPSMLARGSGAIVNVASLAGKSPLPYASIYSTSKAGLIGFTHALGSEIEGSGVTVGVVCPGFVSDAGMWATHEAGGAVKAPALVRAVAPQKVADGVLKVIRGATEVIVASGPMRPLLAFGELAPGQKRSFTRRLGVREVFRKEAERLQQGDDRRAPPAQAPALALTPEASEEVAVP